MSDTRQRPPVRLVLQSVHSPRPRPSSEIHRIARIGEHLGTGRRRLVRAPDCGLAKHRRQKGEVLGPCRAIPNVLHAQQFSSSADGLPTASPTLASSRLPPNAGLEALSRAGVHSGATAMNVTSGHVESFASARFHSVGLRMSFLTVSLLSILLEVLGIAVLIGAQVQAARMRRGKASQQRIDSALVAMFVIGSAFVLGGLVVLLLVLASSGPANSPRHFVFWAISQIVFITVGLIFVSRHLKRVRRLNELGREHPLCRHATVDLEAPPEVALSWARSATRSAHGHDIEIDTEAQTLWAKTTATLQEGGRIIDIQVEPLATGVSHVVIYSWPTNMVKRDFGTGQYFVDRLAEKLREISTDPPNSLALTPIKKWG